MALWSLSKLEDAVPSLRRASEINPNFENLFLLASLLNTLAQYNQGLETIDRALQLKPESSNAHFLRGLLLIPTSPREAFDSFERAFNAKSNVDRTMINSFYGKSIEATLAFRAGHFDQVRSLWKELQSYATKKHDATRWMDIASAIVIIVAKGGQLDLARELIASANLDEQLFPLARALDYLLKGDEVRIEKLSPEVRKIVDEIVNTLNPSGENLRPKKRTNKRNQRR